MTAGVVITGPISPADIADLLTPADRSQAESIRGYRGIPTTELVRALLQAGEDIEVVTTAGAIKQPVELQGPRLRLLVAPSRTRARDLALSLFRDERRSLEALLNQTKGDIIHAHWTYEFAWAALNVGRPVLVTAHDAPLTILAHMRDSYRAFRALMAYIVRMRIGHLTAVSPYLAARWRSEMLYRRPIEVIPNIAPRLPTAQEVPAERNGAALVDVADVGRGKNVLALVEALALLRSEGRDLSLHLVGQGLGADESFAAGVRARGLSEGIEFHGVLSREALATVLARSTVFVHPSREESFGLCLLEAMAMGLPVVGGVRSGGVPWVLDGGSAGVLVDVERPSDIAAAVGRLLDDPQAANDVADRGRRRAIEAFAPETVASAYLEQYERVLTAGRAG